MGAFLLVPDKATEFPDTHKGSSLQLFEISRTTLIHATAGFSPSTF